MKTRQELWDEYNGKTDGQTIIIELLMDIRDLIPISHIKGKKEVKK